MTRLAWFAASVLAASLLAALYVGLWMAARRDRDAKVREALRDTLGLTHGGMLPGSVDHGSRTFPCHCVVHQSARAALSEPDPYETTGI